MKNTNKIVRPRHKLYFILGRPIARLIALFHGYKVKSHFKMKKGESYLILSNHQTDFDGFLTMLSFNRMPYAVIADTAVSSGLGGKLLDHCFGVIPKKKGVMDINANAKMKQYIDEGGSLLLFPEGNRTYAEFQFSFTKAFAKFVKNLKTTVILFNIHGGTGVLPRFAGKARKGPFYGKIKTILTYDYYKDMSDEELYNLISENLKVYDSSSNQKYVSDRKAEYLERVFFVCPKCGKVECLVSKGNYIQCTNCGFTVEYKSNLHLQTNDDTIKFEKMLDWYNYQIRFIRDMEVPNGVIFSDEDVELFTYKQYKAKKRIEKGRLELTKDYLRIGDTAIEISGITMASPISGTKFNIVSDQGDFIVKGHKRFNPLKYVFMFNKLDTKMKLKNLDIHYNLEEREQ